MVRLLSASGLAGALLVGSGCVVNVAGNSYIERSEERFDATGVVDLHLSTFDGPIEVRSWDQPEVRVVVEKRGQDKTAVSKIQVASSRKDNRIEVNARHAGGRNVVIGIGVFTSSSAKLIATVPRKANLVLRTDDGAVVVDRVDGRVDARTDDGSIKVIESSGELIVESRDGSIHLDGIAGRVEARTGDGSLRISGAPTVLRARSGDGSIVLRLSEGTVMADGWTIQTSDGSISAYLPEVFDAEVEADPGSGGRVRNQITLTNVTGGTRADRVLHGRLGKGGHLLLLRTGDGTIRLVH
jgi:hypothetical protein